MELPPPPQGTSKEFLNCAVFFIEVKVCNPTFKQYNTHRIRRTFNDIVTFDKELRKDQKRQKIFIPKFPVSKDLANIFDKETFTKIGEYLSAVSQDAWESEVAMQFFELSHNSYTGIIKVKETFIKKRGGGRFKQKCTFFKLWKRRFLAITSEGIMYSLGNSGVDSNIREMLMFDQTFEMQSGKEQTGSQLQIIVNTSARKLFLECYSLFHFYDVLAAFKEAISLSPYISINRFDSFAPERKDADCKWFIDGKDYFEDIYDKLIKAKHSIYITDWWLSPENFLLRPVGESTHQESRIDRLLQETAERGVKIMIIVFKEPTIALTLDSAHTKARLQSLSQNIVVLRHPDYLLPFLWSHHEKMVIIDQEIGYIGGLDLCFGRWDTQKHEMTDISASLNGEEVVNFPGIEYSNARISDFEDVKNHENCNIDRNQHVRMPWHDVHMRVIGTPVKDMVRHFVQYWNFSMVDIYSKGTKIKDKVGQLIPEKEVKPSSRLKTFKNKMKNSILNIFHKLIPKKPSFTSQNSSNSDKTEKEKHSSANKHANAIEKQKSRFSRFLNELKREDSEDFIKEEHDKYNHFSSLQQKNSFLPQGGEMIINNEDCFEGAVKDYKKTQTGVGFKITNLHQEHGVGTERLISSSYKQNIIISEESSDLITGTEELQYGEQINRLKRYQCKTLAFWNKNDTTSNFNNESDSFSESTSYYHDSQLINPNEPLVSPSSTKNYTALRKFFGSQQKKKTNLNQISLFGGIKLLEKIKEQSTHLNDDVRFFQKNDSLPMLCQSEAIGSANDTKVLEFTSQNNFKSKMLQEKCKAIQKKQGISKKIEQKLDDDSRREKSSNLGMSYINYEQSGTCKCQMLRSGSSWSLGLRPQNTEMSIQVAYIQLISEAKHFIYIENQFFISCTAGTVVNNQIAQALIDRIVVAETQKENFFVCVVMPLLPGFAGEVYDSNSAIMKCQLHWEYNTISRGGSSIYEILKQKVTDPFKYIRFFGLRNHCLFNRQPQTEIIYVHSKLMIVDDQFVVIGSANINDRSLTGVRDSEIAMIVEDSKKIESRMDSQKVIVGQFGHTFRRSLYEEHFGLTTDEARDPLDPSTLSIIFNRTRKNTQIYREVFRCYPDDEVDSLAKIEEWMKTKKLDLYEQKKNEIIGFAVEFPLNFLIEEKLNFSIVQKEYYVPVQNFLQSTWKRVKASFKFFLN